MVNGEQKAREQITWLYSTLNTREAKYFRNFNRYFNNGDRRDDIWDPYVYPYGYSRLAANTDGAQTNINVIRSCVDTVTSKISQANVRPFFVTDAGDYQTTKSVRLLQHFSDVWLDEQHAYPKSVLCFRDAATFDLGVMKIDAESQSIQRVAPWEYFIDPAEYAVGSVSRAMHYRKRYPLIGLKSKIINKKVISDLENNQFKQVEYAIYYDLYQGLRYDFADHDLICDPVKLDYEQYGGLYRRPFVEMYYNRPMKGFYSTSLADDLYPIQYQIDEIVKRLDQAIRQSVINMALVPEGSSLKPSNLQNGVAAYAWRPAPEGNSKPEFFTPPAINNQYIEALRMYIDQAYQMAGISQLSAQGQKPSGLDSGKALRTMEDIESDRFNVQLQQFTHFLVDVMRVCIDCFPGEKEILPKKTGRPNATWGEIRKQRDQFSIDFSAASALSKDPSAKMEEINKLMAMGYINQEMGASMLDMPDLRGAHSISTSSLDFVEKIIDDAIINEIYDFDEVVNLNLLGKECISAINRLSVAEDYKSVDRVKKLLAVVYDTMKNVDEVTAQIEQPAEEVPNNEGEVA